MSKTVEEVYQDRNALAVAFCVSIYRLHRALLEGGESKAAMEHRAGWHPPTDEDDADADEWAVVWAIVAEWQASWHVPREMVESADLPKAHIRWDGHSREEKNRRIVAWAEPNHLG